MNGLEILLIMSNVRIIARLDIKGPNLIKGVRFEGVRVLGNPQTFAQKYYEQGIDEIIYIDTVASLYDRISLFDLVERTAQGVFVPITVGGGIRSIENVKILLRSGADKVAINTAAVKRPELIREVSQCFGSQCMVLSIEACKQDNGEWEAYTDNGREHSGLEVVSWAKQAEKLGAGEILLTSVNRDGTCKGFDIDLIKKVSESVSIPVIASGGMGRPDDFIDAVKQAKADAVAIAHVLHYNKCSIFEIRNNALQKGIQVR
jgi:imidazole glycerol-phosphate synthase subunit HisF